MVVREVERGAGIHPASGPLHLSIDEASGPGRRAFEEHVLEIVGEAELVRRLVASARLHPQLNGDDVARPMLFDDDANAVEQDVTNRGRGRRSNERRALRGTRARHQRQKRDEQRDRDARRGGHGRLKVSQQAGRMPDPAHSNARAQRRVRVVVTRRKYLLLWAV